MKQISFIEDIFKSIGVNSDEQKMIKSWIRYINEQSKRDDIFAIHIPLLGVLHKNSHMMFHSKATMNRDSEEYQNVLNQVLEMTYFKEQKNFKSPHLRKPGTVVMQYVLKDKYQFPEKSYYKDRQIKEVYAAIEKEQNK